MMITDRPRRLSSLPVIRWRSALLAAFFLVAGWAAASAPAVAADDRYKVVNGIAAYLGVIPAAILRGHAATHAERTMHGGVPTRADDYHLVVALFEGSTGARISDASVSVTIGNPGHVGETRVNLEPMTIAGTVTYGAFASLAGRGRHVIAVEIRRPGVERPTRIEFTYSHGRP